MTYLKGEEGPQPSGCIFCLGTLAAEDHPRMVLWRGRKAFVIMNRYPYANGHVLVAPFRHTAEPAELEAEEVLEMHQLATLAQSVIGQVLAPHGFNLGMNLGDAGGAGIVDHLHLHLVPRWRGDTNFMPVLAEVRVVPQHIEETFRLLRQAFVQRFGGPF